MGRLNNISIPGYDPWFRTLSERNSQIYIAKVDFKRININDP